MDGQPGPSSRPSVDPPHKIRRDTLKLINCLSIDDIREIRSAWKCSSADCWRLKDNHATTEIGPFQSETNPPIILECGHYLCHWCTEQASALINPPAPSFPFSFSIASMSFQDTPAKPYKCESKGCESTREYKKVEEIRELPFARHIEEFVKMFRMRGLPCSECEDEHYNQEFKVYKAECRRTGWKLFNARWLSWTCGMPNHKRTMTTAKEISFNHDRDMIVVCHQEKCSNLVYNNSQANSLNEYVEKNKIDVRKKLLCLECARKNHSSHRDNIKRIESIHVLNEKIGRDQLKGEDFTLFWSKSVKGRKRFPWNLVTISRKNAKKIVDDLLRCNRCKEPYIEGIDGIVEDRSPVFLSCGHLVCQKCENQIRSFPESCNRGCEHTSNGRDVKELPDDIKYMFNLNIDEYKKCATCNFFFPPSLYVEGSDDSIYCVFDHFPDIARATAEDAAAAEEVAVAKAAAAAANPEGESSSGRSE
ncbi:hypothetical protein PFISCL1PPCAC_16022 [Pristionchus fissidentatus]|uniref:RING-type domain-containing protein n=1 Tax=Pristionchus fissidentatus TaxID=1538716 RepID=A0AAV5VYT0_9BILA|nr:hypothetical protein PFISCL1PPCAC_16022 [Pristionchus fissidentatus]